MIKLDKQGVYDNISEEDYHADPCPKPSASSSILKTILNKSPLHAFMEHPRLNPKFVPNNKRVFDLGSASHAKLLGKGAEIVVIDADAYRTKDAKEQRQAAWDAGKTPLLVKENANVEKMVAAAIAQLEVHPEGAYFLDNCFAEQTSIWEENGVWCRSRSDKITSQRQVLFDYKTTGKSAHPEEFLRTVINLGYDLSAAHYLMGERVINEHNPHYRFIVQENFEPFALSVIAFSPAFLEIGMMKRQRAMAYWQACLKNDKWLGYPPQTLMIDPPNWELYKWIDEEGNALSDTHEETQAILKTWDTAQKPKGAKSVYE